MLSTGAGDETLLSARFICVSARTPGLRAPEGWLLSAHIGPAGGCGAGGTDAQHLMWNVLADL